MLGETVVNRTGLSESDRALIRKVEGALPVLADVCRADLLLYCRAVDGQAVIVGQAQPHSVSPLYEEDRIGSRVETGRHPEIINALNGRLRPGAVHTVEVRGATIARQLYPLHNDHERLIAVLSVDSYWLAYERHRRRSVAFQDALKELIGMALRGELEGTEELTPFGEHDGLLLVGAEERVEYMSGIALSMYRRLGFRDSLVGVPVEQLDTADYEMVRHVMGGRRPLERTDEQYGLTWVRKALPVNSVGRLHVPFLDRWLGQGRTGDVEPYGVLIMLHDATEALEARRELESKTALIREVHHRVKNNLQVIASLMRMQARRVGSEEARLVLEESVNRILSVAVVHEFLSQNAQGAINLQEVSNRIVSQVQRGLIDPHKRLQLAVRGKPIWLPAERATQCALVINELVQNAIEHGMNGIEEGFVDVELIDEGERVKIVVTDSGVGLPEDFDLDTHSHLGLRIVRSMVERDLRGRFEMYGFDEHAREEQARGDHARGGTRAVVQFDKAVVGGS